MDELVKALKNTSTTKSPGPDSILPEILVHSGSSLKDVLLTMFNRFWKTEELPPDMINANICILLKKGDRIQCGNYRVISLLSVVGKVFADIILQRLQQLADKIDSESQSGYIITRSIIDGIFTLRQIMEKSREQQQNLHIAFIDFTKAFDCVTQELMFAFLRKLGCPFKFFRMIKKLYLDMKARLIVDGELPRPIK